VTSVREQLRNGWWLLVLALSLITFVAAHQLVFVATYGDDAEAALTRSGHGDQWSLTVVLVGVMAVVLVGLAVRELVRLSREARRLGQGAGELAEDTAADLARDALTIWVATLLLSLLVFVLVENLEHLSHGHGLPGVVVLLSDEYHYLLLVFGLVSGLISLVASLYRWRREVLVQRIAAATRGWPRPRHVGTGRVPILAARSACLRLLPPGRAPPLRASI
jgi:hypothetical protein